MPHPVCNFSDNDNKCINRAYYNYKNSRPIFCKNHKLINMIDTSKPVCSVEECLLRGIFKVEEIDNIGKKNKIYFCSRHSPAHGCSNTNHKKCIFVSEDNIKCEKRALYGFELDKKCLYCSNHKKENMVHIGNLSKIKKN